MSDCFDHEWDAWEERCSGDHEYGEGEPTGDWELDGECDPLYYHEKVKFPRVVRETGGAYLFALDDKGGVWVPKSICRRLHITGKGKVKVWVHRHIYAKCTKVQLG